MKQPGVPKKNNFRKKYTKYAKVLMSKDNAPIKETSKKQKE